MIKDLEADVVRGAILRLAFELMVVIRKTVRQSASWLYRVRMVRHYLPVKHKQWLWPLLVPVKMSRSLMRWWRKPVKLHVALQFPPYSVGEAGRVGSPGRREIGHGKLAWRALRPLLPKKDEFPYTIRLVSEITESWIIINGDRMAVPSLDGCRRAG